MKKFLRIAGGVILALGALGGLITFAMERRPEVAVMAVVLAVLAVLLLRPRRSTTSRRTPAEAPLEPQQATEPVDAYINTGSMVYRTDGKKIEDREVPYLVEAGLRDVLEHPAGAPADATEAELRFLAALEDALRQAHKSTHYTVTRMSNKALTVRSASYVYLGKIKLQGRKTWMQYPKRGGNFDVLEGGTLEDYVALIPRWVKIA